MEIREYLQNLHDEGNFREIPSGCNACITDYSTNDYMGLGSDTELQAKFFADPVAAKVPMTSSASRLLAPRQIEYTNLEVFLKLLYSRHRGTDTAALLFNSGYHANTGLISAIASTTGTLVVADKLVHASIIDGIVLSRAPFQRFRHNDFNHLEQILQAKADNYSTVLVVVESVYSMDGDQADIEQLLAIKHRYPNVMLYVDEAHAFGVLGPKGLGLSAGCSAPAEIDVIVGTFGKAAASMGAFAIIGLDMRDFLVNTSRSFIFSTALPPMQMAWTRFTVGALIQQDAKREQLANLGRQLKGILEQYTTHPCLASHIQPLIVGDPKKAVELSRRLLTRYGIKVLPIRRPTVPPGTERLRFSLSSAMTSANLADLDTALRELM
jgi:8-amino-7-oxononanoate synthase